MGHGGGIRPPYGEVLLTCQISEDPIYRGYIQGRLALAGMDLHVPVSNWLDAVWAVYVDAPHKLLTDLAKERVVRAAQLRPDRDTWGATPEHQALGRGLVGQDVRPVGHGKPGQPLPAEVRAKMR